MFTIYSDNGSDSTLVSNLFIDEYMKSANDAQIKIYLYLLRIMGAHRATSVSELADQFNHTEKDVVRSLHYWEKKGLLDLAFDKQENLVSIRLRKPAPAGDRHVLPFAPAGRRMPDEGGAEQVPGLVNTDAPLRMAAGENYPSSQFSSLRHPRTQDFSALQGGAAVSSSAGTGSQGGGRPNRAVLGQTAAVSAAREESPDQTSAVSAAETGAAGQAGQASPAAGESTGQAGQTSPAAKEAPAQTGQTSPAAQEAPAQPSPSAEGLSELEALENFRSDPGRAQLLFVIEQYIGKPLSLNEIRIIYNISEKLRFSDELLDHLLQYCVDRGKRDFRYIRKVAENWASQGIMTPAQAVTAASKESAGTGRKAPKKTLSAEEKTSRRPRSSNSFNQFEQNSYDFDSLEEELLQS